MQFSLEPWNAPAPAASDDASLSSLAYEDHTSSGNVKSSIFALYASTLDAAKFTETFADRRRAAT